MHILITGGTGFIGQRLALRLLQLGGIQIDKNKDQAIERITLADAFTPAQWQPGLEGHPNVAIRIGDISDGAYVDSLFSSPVDVVFHLASIVSAHGEQDFDLAMRVNLDGTRLLFEAIRKQRNGARVVFTSSVAAFGGDSMPDMVGDTSKLTPTTTYGVTKVIGELWINDYTRKGYFDGRSARLPTVIVRPGKPNKAASSFVSGLFREPLNGEPCIIPVDPSVPMPVLGYRAIVDGIIRLTAVEGDRLGSDRGVGLPALNVNVQNLMDALHNAAGHLTLGQHVIKPDPDIAKICAGWPKAVDGSRALSLGLPVESTIEEIVEYYVADYL